MASKYIEQSAYHSALLLEKIFSRRSAQGFTHVFGALSLLALSIGLLKAWRAPIALSEFFGAIFFLNLLYLLFLNYLQKDKLLSPEEVRLALSSGLYGKNLTFAVTRILDQSTDDNRLSLGRFFAVLLEDKEFLWMLRRLNIKAEQFQVSIRDNYRANSSLFLSDVLRGAASKALAANHLEIRLPDLLVALYNADESFRKILFDFQIEEADIREVSFWHRRQAGARERKRKFWTRENLLNTKGIGKNWSGGYTVRLDKIAIDLTGQAALSKVAINPYGHRTQIELLSRMLLAGEGQVAIVGNPGVGRHTMLRAFAQAVNNGQVFAPLRYMRILQIDTGSVVSGAASLNDVVARIEILFNEAYRAGNIILVVNDIDAFLDPQPEAGRVNATEALIPYFQSSLKIIGVTTPRGYQATIGKNSVVTRYFSKLEISEPSPAETLWILEDAAAPIERRSGLIFTLSSLKEIVKLAAKLIQNLPQPEKSIEILESTAIDVATNTGDRIVLLAHVQKVVSQRTKIPVGQVSGPEKDKLLVLEEILHERIIGQDEAIAALANALRRARSGIRSEKRPIGSFLFLGPTGVGKTETTKALASLYFGSEQRIIRFDMSEFQELHAINRFLGNADTGEGGILTEKVMANPFSLILLDEIEKANARVLDLFLQVLDEGRLTDALGRTVDFTHTMIIATSNAGSEMIRTMVKDGKNPAVEKDAVIDHIQRVGLFRPEFINRFDAVLVFRPLAEIELLQVSALLLAELNKRLKEKDIQIRVTPELTEAVAKGGFDPEFGARPLRRFIQEHIENYIAEGLLAGKIKRGDTVEVDPNKLTG